MPGKLIVLEGADGSGKSTQFSLLCNRLKEEGVDFQRLIFPQYSEPSSALLRMYLNGEFGSSPSDVNPYAASTFYAVDRYASFAKVWGEYYRNGGLILADRYTTSNAVHQAPKLPPEQRSVFLEWLYSFEYHLLELPAPDLVLFLDMPNDLALRLIAEREVSSGTARDIHELDGEYLRLCREAALDAASFSGWQTVSCCTADGTLRTPENLHEEIYQYVRALL